MRRDLYAWARRLAAAGGAAALLFAGSHLSAQQVSPGGTGQGPRVGLMGAAEDEILPRLYVGPKGDVFRLWLRAGDTQRGGGAVLLAVAKPDNAWQTLLEIRPSEKGTSYRDAYLAMSPSNQLAVLYRRKSNQAGTKHIGLARSDDGGKTWTHSAIPADASSRNFEPKAVWGRDGSLVVVWSDERRGQRLFDVYARRSPDGGKTWDPEQLVSRFPRQLPSDLNARPMLVGDGQDRVWSVWVGVRSGRSALYLTRSTDGGRTWTDPQALTGDSESVFAQSLLRAGKHMLLLWQDTRTGQDKAYAASSTDDGATWTNPVRVDHLPADSQVAVDGVTGLLAPDGEALVAWKDGRNGRTDIFLARSTDGGRTWGSEDRRLDMDEPGTAVSGEPMLARSSDGRVALAWEDDRAGYEGIYLRVRSTGDRQDWGPEISVAAPVQKRAMRTPQLAWGPDGQLYAVWEVWDHTRGATSVTKRVDSRTVNLSKP
jgi:hypothetical protein